MNTKKIFLAISCFLMFAGSSIQSTTAKNEIEMQLAEVQSIWAETLQDLHLTDAQLAYTENVYTTLSNHESFKTIDGLVQETLTQLSKESFYRSPQVDLELEAVVNHLTERINFFHATKIMELVAAASGDCAMNTDFPLDFCAHKLPTILLVLYSKNVMKKQRLNIISLMGLLTQEHVKKVTEKFLSRYPATTVSLTISQKSQ